MYNASTPLYLWQFGMQQHASNSLHDCSIHSLSKSVQLMGLQHCIFDPNTLTLAVFLELPFILANVFCSDNLQLPIRLLFDSCLELLEK